MTLMVTGATGHVGGEIVRQAARRGMEVSRSRATMQRRRRAALDQEAAPRSRRRRSRCANLAAQHKVDACIHAAAISNEAYARPDPLDAIATNVGGTANLLEAARLGGWRRFVLVSTGSVFSLRERHRRSRSWRTRRPRRERLLDDQASAPSMLTRMYRTEYGLSASTVRISWVFGPPVISDQPQRGPIPSYLLRALRGEAIREGGADFCRELHLCGGCRRGTARGCGRAASCAIALYHFGHGVNFTAAQAADGGAQGGAGRHDRACPAAPSRGRATPRCAARSRASGFSRTPATRRRTRSKPASRPMRTGCAPIRNCGGADQVSGSMTCCAKAGRLTSR